MTNLSSSDIRRLVSVLSGVIQPTSSPTSRLASALASILAPPANDAKLVSSNLASLLASLSSGTNPRAAEFVSPLASSRRGNSPAIDQLASAIAWHLSNQQKLASPSPAGTVASAISRNVASRSPDSVRFRRVTASSVDPSRIASKTVQQLVSAKKHLEGRSEDFLASAIARHLASPRFVSSPREGQVLASRVASAVTKILATDHDASIVEVDVEEVLDDKKTGKRK